MATPKTHTIIKYRRGNNKEIQGTLEELIKYFGYTLDSGHSYNRSINVNPKTIKGLISALNKAVNELQSGSFDPDHYSLKH